MAMAHGTDVWKATVYMSCNNAKIEFNTDATH